MQYGKNSMRARLRARRKAECYIRVETKPECYFFHVPLIGLLYWLVNSKVSLGTAVNTKRYESYIRRPFKSCRLHQTNDYCTVQWQDRPNSDGTFVFAKSAIFAQVCYIFQSVLYFPEVGQIQHGAIKYGNKTTL